LSNYPNPFEKSTTIKYSIPLDCRVSLKIFSVYGQAVANLFEGAQKSGTYTFDFNGAKLSKGVYFCVLTAVSGKEVVFKVIKLVIDK